MSHYERGKRHDILLVSNGNQITEIPKEQVLGHFGSQRIVRIPCHQNPDFRLLGETVVHFGLEVKDFSNVSQVILPKIVTPGSYDRITGEENLPVLSLEEIFIGTVLQTNPSLTYDQIPRDIFNFPIIGGMRTIEEVQEEVVNRYSVSLKAARETVSTQKISVRWINLNKIVSYSF